MASFLSTCPSPIATLPSTPKVGCITARLNSFSTIGGPMVRGLRLVPSIKITKAAKRSSPLPSCFKTTISCSIAQPETLKAVQSTIAKQLSIDESTVAPETKFVDLGA
ncbi:hypothetical protein L1049_004849 [Liquidambar formosana]|uniref:Acyl carrier protein n=1 Tax=Liquidambar formosana TaxID=63359 RepID=A0AAP0RPX9_LIQFO